MAIQTEDTCQEECIHHPVMIRAESEHPIKCLDMFAYRAGGDLSLERHVRYAAPPEDVELDIDRFDMRIVAIANSAHRFNDSALRKYDSMELLRYAYRDENPQAPLLSGTFEGLPGDTLMINLKPVLARIVLESVEHDLDGYRRMEDPLVFLENVPADAEVLRADGHRPAETTDDTLNLKGLMWENLPCDIGIDTQYPGTAIFCYPCDDGLSVSRPTYVLECTIDGERHRFSTPLPAISRNGVLYISLSVKEDPPSYGFSIR